MSHLRTALTTLALSAALAVLAGCPDDECREVEVVECNCEQGTSHTDACTGICVCEPDCVDDYQAECRENSRVGRVDCSGVCIPGATLPDAGAEDVGVDAGPDDAGPDDSGPSDAGDGTLACAVDGCELPCGEQICDGATQACHVYPPGIDLGRPDDGGPSGSATTYSCEPIPLACASDLTCDCITAEDTSGTVRSCAKGEQGFTVEHFGQ